MRQALLLLVLAAPGFGKMPEGDADIVVLYSKQPSWKRSAWLEALRRFESVDKDDKQAIRALSRQKFTARNGKVGSEPGGFAFDVPRERALKSLMQRLKLKEGATEPRAALKLWHWNDFDLENVSNYLFVKKVAAAFVNADTIGIWFPRRGAYFQRPSGMSVDDIQLALQEKFPLSALGLTRNPGISVDERWALATKIGGAEARKRFGEFHKAYVETKDRYERRRKIGLVAWSPYFTFTVRVSKSEERPRGLDSYTVNACSESFVSAKESNRRYKLAEVVDWTYAHGTGLARRHYGGFVPEAFWCERGLLTSEK